MNAFGDEPSDLVRDELAAVERVIRSGWWVLGPEVAAFEAAWAARVRVTSAVGVANGLEALEIGMLALGIGEGDEVITTPMTAFATVLAILRTGATPVLADIDLDTAILDPASVERCLTPRTRAVVLVHLYGQVGPVTEIGALCRDRDVHLLEDCAQAHGATLDGRPAGSFGTLAAWSFYPTKNLGTVGDAGAITTDAKDLAERAKVLRNYGQAERYIHAELGLNSRLDEVHAAILQVRLERLDGWLAARRAVASLYQAQLSNPAVELLPAPSEPERHVHHLFVLRCARRDDLAAHLGSRGVETLSHYPVPIHGQQIAVELARDPRGLGAAERHAAECLSLPCHPQLAEAEIEHVISAVNAFE
jgi:dTDP-4-amino-4,6-dideoxygalactose transaminase